jgi:hypothetical protein
VVAEGIRLHGARFHDVHACIFDQKGLMGGIGFQGSKITQIHPD